ncbi:hypothetical protein ACHAW6_004607 [Cyclotella cf. meneghiniana]
MDGNLINYPDDCSTSTADLLLITLFFNCVITIKGEQFANADLSKFYLRISLRQPDFVKIKIDDIPKETIIKYKLPKKAIPDGLVYIQITKKMNGLQQADSLANELLEWRLQNKIIPGF